jgi:hypothetical protein
VPDELGSAICNVLPLEDLRVVADAERAEVDARRPELRQLGEAHRPWMQLREPRRSVFLEQPFLGRLHVWIAGTAPPDVAARVRRLGTDLRVGLARAFAHHSHRDPARALERRNAGAALLVDDRAVDRKLPLAERGARRAGGEYGCDEWSQCDVGVFDFIF